MKILADDNIAQLDYFFADAGEIIKKAGEDICAADLIDADVLLVRSKTKVNKELLANSCVKFVGSCVSGIDHLDISYLKANKIPYFAATGCNAQAVADYDMAILANLIADKLIPKVGAKIGVIGYGNIGQKIVPLLAQIGCDVLVNDPPLDDLKFFSKDIVHTELNAFANLDCVFLHPSLTHSKSHPSYHLLGEEFFKRQKSWCVIVNAARGEIIDSAALKSYGSDLIWCMDVWENEPNIDADILKKCYIATPHIAGHSIHGKVRGTQMVYDCAALHFNWKEKDLPLLPQKPIVDLAKKNWCEEVASLIDLKALTQDMQSLLLKSNANLSEEFIKIRKAYVPRHELDFNGYK